MASLVIALALAAGSACSARRAPDSGPLRVMVPFDLGPLVERAAVSRPPHEDLLRFERIGFSDAGTWCLHFRGREARWPDGSPFLPRHLVEAWEREARDPAQPHAWLLGPLAGLNDFVAGTATHIAGLVLEGEDRLQVCFTEPTPDWRLRWNHPALWPVRGERAEGFLAGPGPYRMRGGRLVRNAWFAPRPPLGAIELVQDGRARMHAERAEGGIDVPRRKRPEARATRRHSSMRPGEGWEAVYALWIEDSTRWLGDPNFRQWLVEVIDRASLAELLFPGAAELATTLSEQAVAPASSRRSYRPFGAASRPELSLVHAPDPDAARIASRFEAVLEERGVAVSVTELEAPALGAALRERRFEIALVRCVRASGSDPILALQHDLWSLGGAGNVGWDILERAARDEDPRRRALTARSVEEGLLAAARLVPLVRLRGSIVPAGARDVLVPGNARVLGFD